MSVPCALQQPFLPSHSIGPALRSAAKKMAPPAKGQGSLGYAVPAFEAPDVATEI